jgi:hypothetical protein
LASALSDVLFMQQISGKRITGIKNPLFRCVIVSVPAFCHLDRALRSDQAVVQTQGGLHHAAAAASFAMLSAAAAADLPRRQPPPPAPAPVGKAPIGKYPVGKAPIGKYPTPGPVVTKGSALFFSVEEQL